MRIRQLLRSAIACQFGDGNEDAGQLIGRNKSAFQLLSCGISAADI